MLAASADPGEPNRKQTYVPLTVALVFESFDSYLDNSDSRLSVFVLHQLYFR